MDILGAIGIKVKLPETEEGLHDHCEERLVQALTYNKTIHKLIDEIESMGCEIPKNLFSCRKCDMNATGGIVLNTENSSTYKPHIVACENHQQLDVESFENTIVHELVHAYDLCRVKAFDWKNCLHHACESRVPVSWMSLF